jgi:hypothetical protein
VALAIRLQACLRDPSIEATTAEGPATLDGWTCLGSGRGVYVSLRHAGATKDEARFVVAPWQAMTGAPAAGAESFPRVVAGRDVLLLAPAKGGSHDWVADLVEEAQDAPPAKPLPKLSGRDGTQVAFAPRAVVVRIPASADAADVEDEAASLDPQRLLVVERAKSGGASSFAVFPPSERTPDRRVAKIHAYALEAAIGAVRHGDPGAREAIYREAVVASASVGADASESARLARWLGVRTN